MVDKWDYELQKYVEYDLPKGACLFQNALDNNVVCAECGKELAYGDCYTSRTIQDSMGFGYGICVDCYDKEFELEIHSINERRKKRNKLK